MIDTTVSAARAIVVAQLLRAPVRQYTDAEIVVLARWLWEYKGYQGGMGNNADRLNRDIVRLIGKYRPRRQRTPQNKSGEHNSATTAPPQKNPIGRPATVRERIRQILEAIEPNEWGQIPIRTTDIAREMGITQRAARKHIAGLVEAGELNVSRHGNGYYGIITAHFRQPKATNPAPKGEAKQGNKISSDESLVLPTMTPQTDEIPTSPNTGLDQAIIPQTRVRTAAAENDSSGEPESAPTQPETDDWTDVDRIALIVECIAYGRCIAAWWLAGELDDPALRAEWLATTTGLKALELHTATAQPPALHDALAELLDSLPRSRLNKKTGELKRWPVTDDRALAHLAAMYWREWAAGWSHNAPGMLRGIRWRRKIDDRALDKKIASLDRAIRSFERRRDTTNDSTIAAHWQSEIDQRQGYLKLHMDERAERDIRDLKRRGITAEEALLLDQIEAQRRSSLAALFATGRAARVVPAQAASTAVKVEQARPGTLTSLLAGIAAYHERQAAQRAP
jgi:hypothetical protein